jgi:hypothetical protein
MRCAKPAPILALSALAVFLAGCAGGSLTQTEPQPQPAAPAPVPTLPPAFPAKDLVGRYGLAAYHNAADRERTEAAARSQCRQPYVINLGPTGGVMMHLADQAQPEELRLKGAPGGKTYIGPEGEPGGIQDREVVSFDGRVLITRFVDPEVNGRYGSMVYVRCGAEGTKPAPAKRKPATARASSPSPAAAPAPAAAPPPPPAQPAR